MYMHVEHQLELAEFYITCMCFKLCFIKNSKSLELKSILRWSIIVIM